MYVLCIYICINVYIDITNCTLFLYRRAIAALLLVHGADVNYSGGKLNEIAIQWAVRNEKCARVFICMYISM
jgi:hypothetical protein